MGFVIQVSDPSNHTKPLSELETKHEDTEDLSEEVLKKGLHTLGRTADGLSQAYLGCNLILKKIHSLDALGSCIHLQDLDISCNSLTDLSPLSNLKYLIRLNASYNRLTEVLAFDPPFNLDYADFSNNKITEIGDLSGHTYLRELRLNNNHIEEISGVAGLKNLKVLALQGNRISGISGIDDLPLQQLDLGANRLESVENIETCTQLIELNVSDNTVASFKGLDQLKALQVLEAAHNKITYIESLEPLRDIPLLKTLNLSVNAIQDVSRYRFRVLEIVPSLVTLDFLPVSPEDKVRARLAAEEASKLTEKLASERAATAAAEKQREIDNTISGLKISPVVIVHGLPAINVHWATQAAPGSLQQEPAQRINEDTQYIFRVLFNGEEGPHRLEIDYQMTEDDDDARVMQPEQRTWINNCIAVHDLALTQETEYAWSFTDQETIAKLVQTLQE
eukprot:TRINITY_DN4309_c0_g1_i2.p1 TRINITY_DN4309_c0_g1~~TRINITY_DN4309_c0_g1_i2.p1  ORF type:complete len:450 (-),score=69.29 TRINITY_DN4309_c0_g1_i2:8-1357(-)